METDKPNHKLRLYIIMAILIGFSVLSIVATYATKADAAIVYQQPDSSGSQGVSLSFNVNRGGQYAFFVTATDTVASSETIMSNPSNGATAPAIRIWQGTSTTPYQTPTCLVTMTSATNTLSEINLPAHTATSTYDLYAIAEGGTGGCTFYPNISYTMAGQNVGADSAADVTNTYFYIKLFDSSGSSTITRIVSTTPTNGTTTATTSISVGGDVYINQNDYATGTYADLFLSNNTCSQATSQGFSALQIVDSIFGNSNCTGNDFQFPLYAGNNIFSTTTVPLVGVNTMVLKVQQPSTYLFVFTSNTTLLSTTTTFTAGAPTAYDTFIASSSASIASVIASSSPITATCFSDWTEFFTNFIPCVTIAIIPSQQQFAVVLNSALYGTTDGSQIPYASSTGIFTKWPVGYITRFTVLAFGNGTSTLPTISAHIPYDGNASDTPIFTLNIDDMFSGGAAMFASGTIPYTSGQTAQQVLEPIVQLCLFIPLLLFIISDIIGIGKHRHKK